jgi:hypothetical protein
MPQFVPGEVKAAKVAMRNPTGKAFDYNGFVYMGTDLVVVSEKSFYLVAAEEKQVSFPVTMPAEPGTYPVHIGVFAEGQSIALYKATEDVRIANIVTVELRNPPADAQFWSLTLTDWDMTVAIHEASGRERLDITEVAAFEIPGGLALPLRVVALQITRWNEDMTALIQLYYAQSMHSTLWDWDKQDWGDEPDPNYRAIFIPEMGGYYFDVAADEFEKRN